MNRKVPSKRDTKKISRSENGGAFQNAVLAILVVLVIAAAVSGIIIFLTMRSGGKKVPNIVGMEYGEAKEKIHDMDLDIEIDADQDSAGVESLAEMTVEAQDPKPGTGVEEGELVTVKLKGLRYVPRIPQNSKPGDTFGPYDGSGQDDSIQPGAPETDAGHGETQISRTVCIDPGHSANCPGTQIDPATGLDVADNSGASGERAAMWELARISGDLLRQQGFGVVLTKNGADDYSSLRNRADIGNGCAIVVRLHFDPGLQAIMYPGEGQYKQRGESKVVVDPGVARSSQKLAEALYPYLREVGIERIMNDVGGTSGNDGPAFVGSVLSRVPIVLIENSPAMVRDNPSGRGRVANAILQGVKAYFQGG